MDAEPYAIAASELTTDHQGQHRCTNGTYYGPGPSTNPNAWSHCPTNVAVYLLVETIATERKRPHEAVHDLDVINEVAGAMLSGPLSELDPEQQEAWRQLARLGLEEFCRLLDVRRDDTAHQVAL